MQHRYVEMYSLVAWDNSIRTKFCLGYDPFYFNERSTEGIAASNARNLLTQLGVFYYRDIENNVGMILEPSVPGGDKFKDKTSTLFFNPPLSCFFFNVKVAYPSIHVLDYPIPDNMVKMEPYFKFKEKWGDNKQWLSWNEPKRIVRAAPGFITHAKKQGV